MARTLFFFCGIIILTYLASGCSDDPNSVGKGLLPQIDQLKIASVETTAVSGSKYLLRIGGYFNRLLVGRNQSYEAFTLLQFSGLSQLLSSDFLEKATLKFSITYRFPDTSGILGIDVRQFQRSFSQSTFTWDSLTGSAIGRTIGGFPDSLLTPQDSSLSISLDTSYVREITQSGSGSLILMPSSGSRLVLGLDNYQDFLVYAGPRLVITVYDSSADSSVTIEYITDQRVFIANEDVGAQTGRLTVQSGVATRCRINFDVSKIPTSASITQAIMVVRLDTVASLRSSFASNVLYTNIVLDTSSLPSIGGVTASSSLANDSLGAYFQFDVRNIVQQWVIGRQNYGVALRSSEEFIALDRYVVFGADASYSLRPKLFVKYTVLP